MKKAFSKLLTFVSLVALIGCDNEAISSTSNLSNSSSSINPNKEKQDVLVELSNKLKTTEENIEDILMKDKVSIDFELNSTQYLSLSLGEEEQVLTDNSMDIKLLNNIDMIAGKKYYQEYLERVEDDETGEVTWNPETVAAIALEDSGEAYSYSNVSMLSSDENGETFKTIVESEEWTYPTTSYSIMKQYTDPVNEEMAFEQNVKITPETSGEDFYFSHYANYESLFTLNMLLSSTTENIPEESIPPIVTSFLNYLEGSVSSEQLLEEFINYYNSTVDEASKLVIDENYKKLIIEILDVFPSIDYYSLFDVSVLNNDGLETYKISINLNNVVKALNSLLTAIESGLANLEDGDEFKTSMSQILLILKNDLTTRLPFVFNSNVSLSFKDNVLVGFDSEFKMEGLVPYTMLLFASVDTTNVQNMTYNIDESYSMDLTISNEEVTLPIVDESKFA